METESIAYLMPGVVLEIGWLLDDSVAELTKVDISPAASAELFERAKEFQAAWDEHGLKLLKPVLTHFPLRFKERRLKAYLLCGSLNSQSHPLLMNVKYYLNSLRVSPRPLSEFADHLFHELLHILLEDNLKTWPTPLVEKLDDESQDVKTHLHLIFLHKFAHQSLHSETQRLKDWYQEIDPVLGHTWALVESESTALSEELHSCFG